MSSIKGIYQAKLTTNTSSATGSEHESGEELTRGWKQYEQNTKLKPYPRAVRQHRGVTGPVIRSPVVHCLYVRGEVADEARANEQEQSHDYQRCENRTVQNEQSFVSLTDLPHRIFSHGSSIVKTNVHSNHIRHLHKNAPSADAGGRFGSERDVITVNVDGAVQDFPSLEVR